MKVMTTQEKFTPITITLETIEEAEAVMGACSCCQVGRGNAYHGAIINNLYDMLDKLHVDYPVTDGEWHFSTT